MTGILQPLAKNQPIVMEDGRPTDYFIRWSQQRQIDINEAITAQQALEIAQEFIDQFQIQAGSGISITPDGKLTSDPVISAEVQAILDQISSTHGTVLFRGSDDWQGLAPGTAGQFLQTQGAGTDPVWAAAGGGGGGGMTLIGETIVTTPVSTITFASIPATFKDLRVTGLARSTAAVTFAECFVRFNDDAGSSAYAFSRTNRFGSSVAANASSIQCSGVVLGTNVASGTAASFSFDLPQYAGTALRKSINGTDFGTSDSDPISHFLGGTWKSTAAVNRLDFFLSSGNFEVGTAIRLWGVG